MNKTAYFFTFENKNDAGLYVALFNIPPETPSCLRRSKRNITIRARVQGTQRKKLYRSFVLNENRSCILLSIPGP